MLTGANGFTGRHFKKHASDSGHEVIPLKANLTDRHAITKEVQHIAPEAVVHLAAISFVGHADLSAFYHVNVIGSINLLEALAGCGKNLQSVLLSSSANIYGNSSVSPITEDQAPTPVNHYAMSKLAMEYMARTYLEKLPLFFTRPFNYTGPGQSNSFIIPKLVEHFALRKPKIELGNLAVEREFNDVRFVCEAYLRLLQKAPVGETFNICSGQPVTLQSVIELLSGLTGHRIDVQVNPDFVRANEIRRLCGSPDKLISVIGNMNAPLLSDTLEWMLAETPGNKH
jgi:nucleoside-diphosphate-sugar epimerase